MSPLEIDKSTKKEYAEWVSQSSVEDIMKSLDYLRPDTSPGKWHIAQNAILRKSYENRFHWSSNPSFVIAVISLVFSAIAVIASIPTILSWFP